MGAIGKNKNRHRERSELFRRRGRDFLPARINILCISHSCLRWPLLVIIIFTTGPQLYPLKLHKHEDAFCLFAMLSGLIMYRFFASPSSLSPAPIFIKQIRGERTGHTNER
jgi:hypothetical protein